MKKTLSAILSVAMLIGNGIEAFAYDFDTSHTRYEYMNEAEKSFVEDTLNNRTYAKYNNTEVFEGHPAYLLDTKFWEDTVDPADQRVASGWDYDYRGSTFKKVGGLNGVYTITANDLNYPAIMSHDLMPHTKGEFVLETQFRIEKAGAEGFQIFLTGDEKDVMRIETTKTHIAYHTPTGELVNVCEYAPDVFNTFKAVVHPEDKTVDLYINNTTVYGVEFKTDTSSIDKVTITTGNKETMTVGIQLINAYINYVVNEKFMATPVCETPADWTMTGNDANGVAVMQSECVDVQSYKLLSIDGNAQILSKSFGNDASKMETDVFLLIPEKKDGIIASLKSDNNELVNIGVSGSDITANGKVIYKDFCENVWYRFNIKTNTETKTSDIELNYKLVAEDLALLNEGIYNTINFSSNNELWVDDVTVIKTLPLPEGYPEAPVIPEQKNDVEVGILMYDMWREGYHYGWDLLSPYTDRMPYLGYYTEGMTETVDWEVKWMRENGIDYQIFPWCGTWSTVDGGAPIKRSLRSFQLVDGLLRSEYDMDFCIMWSYPNPETVHGIEDFKNNILPYWVENFFKHPNYKTVNNKLLMYAYNLSGWSKELGGEEQFMEALDLCDSAAKELGFDGFILLSSDDMTTENAKKYGFGLYRYGWSGMFGDPYVMTRTMDSMANQGMTYANPIGMGYDVEPWRDGNNAQVLKPEDFKNIVNYVVENNDRFIEQGNEMGNFITLTCWNEWGEGHYFAPSTKYGFSYLNTLRELLTEGDTKEQALPSEKSLARVGVMYPLERQLLKGKQEANKDTLTDNLVLMERIDFSNPEDYERVEIHKSVSKIENRDGMVVATAVDNDPGFFINCFNVEAAKVKMIRVTASQPDTGMPFVFFGTTDEPDTGVGGKRFVGPLSGGNILNTADCTVYKPEKLTGMITQLRYDPPDNTRGEFALKSIEIWGTETIEKDVKVQINGEEFNSGAKVIADNGTTYMSVFTWIKKALKEDIDYEPKTGCVKISFKDGTEIEIFGGRNEYYFNGEKKEFKNTPRLVDGRMFVPIREFFGALGYSVDWDGEGYKVILEKK